MTLLALGKYTGHLENIQDGYFPFPSSSYLCWSVVIWGYQRRCVAMLMILLMMLLMMPTMKMIPMAICADWPWKQMSSSGVCHFRSRDLILARKCPNEKCCVYFDDGEGDEVHGGNLKRSPYMQSQASLAVRFLRHDIEKGQWYNILYLNRGGTYLTKINFLKFFRRFLMFIYVSYQDQKLFLDYLKIWVLIRPYYFLDFLPFLA